MGNPTKVIAGSVGLTAFALAVIAGLAAGNTTPHILTRALVSMIVVYTIGMVLGLIGERTIHEHLKATLESQPPALSGVNVDKMDQTLKTGGKPAENVAAG